MKVNVIGTSRAPRLGRTVVLLALACTPTVTPTECACSDPAAGDEAAPLASIGPVGHPSAAARDPDFVTNVELTSPDESQVLGLRVAVYERPTADLAPRELDRGGDGEDFGAGLLFGAQVVRDDQGVALGVTGRGITPTRVPRSSAALDAWVFADGDWVETVALDERDREWPVGHVLLVVTREDARAHVLGEGWTIAIEP